MDKPVIVLIVNSVFANIDLLSDALKNSFETITAADEQEAFDILRLRSSEIGAVLMGSVMPELAEQIKSDPATETIPIVMVTPDADQQTRERAVLLGASDIVPRGADKDTIERCIRSVQHMEQEETSSDSQNENRFDELLDNAPGGIAYAEIGSHGELCKMYVNREFAELLGFGDRESCIEKLGGDAYWGISAQDTQILRDKTFDAVTAGGGQFKHTYRCTTLSGDDIWLQALVRVSVSGDGKETIRAHITDYTQEKVIENDLRITAYFDRLTGLYNRSAFIKNAQRMLDENPLTEFSMMKLDIGSFKVINDIFGREIGDRVLIRIADVMREILGKDSVYARFFADNFVMMIPYSERSVHPQMILDSVQKAIAESGDISHEIQLYIGVYKITDRSLTADHMVDRASMACRSINGSFREHIAYYDENMRKKVLEEQEIRDDSRRALKNGEFYVCYQPIYGIKAKKFVSAEALVRWNHPTKGMIQPAKFIPVFEKNGFVAELDLYVLEQVCIYMKKRADNGLPPFPISVNVSRMSLYNPNIFSIISDLTTRYKVDPQYFRIEITESAYNDNPAQLLDTVGRLRGKCYPVLMDDFGSGYSSLNTLKDIPIDILKLDMKFMQGFETNAKVGTIVTAISRMSKWLNVPMLAEGVETKEQYDFLVSVGCSYIQGFYFSRPVPEKDFTDLIVLEEVSAAGELVNSSEPEVNVNELLGSSPVVSKFIGSVFGGLGIYEMVDGRLELVRVNEGYMQIMGYSVDDLNGNNIDIWKHVHPDDVEKSKNACLEAMKTDKAVRAIVRRYDRDGQLLYLEGIHRRLGGSDESPIFCIAFNNINEQLRSDKIIERSKNRIEEVLLATNSMIVDVDFEMGEVFLIGDKSYDVCLDSVDAYTGPASPFADIVHPDDREKAERFHSDLAPGRRSVELRMKKSSDGEYYWWRITVFRHFSTDGKLMRLVGTATNINAEKSTQIALKQANINIETAMNGLTVGILVLEVSDQNDPHILFSNDMFWKIIGKKRADSEFFDIVHNGISEEDLKRISEDAKKGSAHMEYRAVRDDGKAAWIDIALAPTQFSDGKRTYMVVVSDITEHRGREASIDAVIRSFESGAALIASSGGKITTELANDKFYNILGVRRDNDQRIEQIVSAVLSSGNDTVDLRIKRDGTKSMVRVHVEQADSKNEAEKRYVITVNDVTLKRAETKNRISERMSYAAAGIYDEVYEINIRARTMKLAYSRRMPNRAENAKPFPLLATMKEWSEKAVHPSDVTTAMKIFLAPLNDPDFTDAYCEIKMKDVYGDGTYHGCGISMVRSGADSCMMFIRANTQTGGSANAANAERDRMFRVITEHTRLAVIEYDCASNRAVCSANIADYHTPGMSAGGLCGSGGFSGIFEIHPEDRPAYDQFLASLNEAEADKAVSVRMETAEGKYEWRRLTAFLKRDSVRNTTKLIMAISRVVSDVKALRKANVSDDLLRRTVQNIPVGIGIFRMDNDRPVPVYISDNVYSLYGIDPNRSDAPVLPTDKLFEDGGLFDGAEGEYALESYHADGSKFWLSVNYRVIEEQGELMLYAALADVSERVESLRHEEAEQQMYQVLLSETRTILFDYKTASKVLTYFSHDGGERTRVTEVEGLIEDPSGFTLLGDADRVNFVLMLGELISEPGSGELPVRIEADGYPRRYKVFMKSVCDSDGKVYEVIGKIEDAEDEMARLDKIRAKAMYDSLCVSVYNKSTTEELIRTELDQSTGGALLMIDMDDFKRINDTQGHIFGDDLLKKFASTVKGVFRDTDIIGRYGGDEFFVFMPHVSAALAEKKSGIILERTLNIGTPELGGIKSSIGVAAVTPENRSYPQLLKQADSALHQAKSGGKNRVVVFDPATMTEAVFRTVEPTRSNSSGSANIVLSSNPGSAASTFMRVFSALNSSSNIGEGISQALELIGKTYNVSRVYIFEDSEDGQYTSNTFEWCNNGVTSEKASLQNVSYEHDLSGNYRDNMNDSGIFYCHDVSTLEDVVQREEFTRRGIKSVLQCPLTDNGRSKGFVGFDECRGNRFWTQDQIDSLVFLSKVLSTFLMKERLKETL